MGQRAPEAETYAYGGMHVNKVDHYSGVPRSWYHAERSAFGNLSMLKIAMLTEGIDPWHFLVPQVLTALKDSETLGADRMERGISPRTDTRDRFRVFRTGRESLDLTQQ